MGCSSSKIEAASGGFGWLPPKLTATVGSVCRPSRFDVDVPVMRCKDRKRLMQDAVAARNAFAAAHAAFAVALKNAGSALSDYGQDEFPDENRRHEPSSPPSSPPTDASASASASVSSAAAAVASEPPLSRPSVDNLPPPPPPLPNYYSPEFLRSSSLPSIHILKSKKQFLADIAEEEEEEDKEGERSSNDNGRPSTTPSTTAPPTPSPRVPQSKATGPWDYFFVGPKGQMAPPMNEAAKTTAATREETSVKPEEVAVDPKQPVPANIQPAASAGVTEQERATGSSFSMLQILKECDDHFLKASESAQEVSKMLEATQMHYHTNFADSKGHIDYAAIIMQAITWNHSFKGMSPKADLKDDFNDEKWETHAVILDKMLAWETKLYDEVKAAGVMKTEYQRKVAFLNKLKERKACSEILEKAKSAVDVAGIRYTVDIQSMDSTVSEIKRLRDYQLYPKLVHLVDGMAKMWESMTMHHGSQHKIITSLRTLDTTLDPQKMSEEQVARIEQLLLMVLEWSSRFQELMAHQKAYISTLNSWLKLSLVPTDSSSKANVPSPTVQPDSAINTLLHLWQDELENLPIEMSLNAIHSFSEVIDMILQHQKEKQKQKEKFQAISREYEQMEQTFESWHLKYMNRRVVASEEINIERNEDPVADRKQALDYLKSKLKDEEKRYQKLCKQVREKSFVNLKRSLMELFKYTAEFALKSSEMYKKLLSISIEQNFKDCIGLIDGMHIDCMVPLVEQARLYRRKGLTQNILAAATPDKLFIYVLAGWEGSANDFTVLSCSFTTYTSRLKGD